MRSWFIGLTLVLLLGISALAAPIEVWSPFSNEWNQIYQELTDTYFTPKTGIDVMIVTLPWDGFEQKYLLAAVSGEMPEIGITGSLGPADLGIRGAAIDLRARFGPEYEEVASQIYPGLMRSFEFYGTAYGLPVQMNTYPAVYRTDIFETMGLTMPQTWDDLYRILPRLQAQNMNFALAFGMAGATYADLSMFIWQHGGDWYNEDRSRSALDRPEALAGFTQFVELFTKHNIPKEENRYMAFREGKVPVMTAPNWDYSQLQWAAPELTGKWTVALAPGTPKADGSINHAGYLGGMTFAMFERAKRTDEAWEWLKWFLSAETQALVGTTIINRIQGALFFPANSAAIDKLPLPQEHLNVFMRQAMYSVAPAYALAPESVTHRFLHNAANKAVLQGVDPKAALQEAADQMNAELRRKQQEFSRFIQRLR